MNTHRINKKTLLWLTPLLGLAMMLGLSACGVDLAGDITPPAGMPTSAAVQPTAVTIAYPLVPPDPSQGQAIFAQHCEPCHGSTGQGDGPQAANLPNPVIAIGQLAIAQASVPANWFSIVTNGNIARYMPGFITGLDDRQRWDVLAYVYSLSLPPDLLAQGQTIYSANCASCHGPAGKGDGPQSANTATKVPDFTAQDRLSQKSDNDLSGEIKAGVGQAMPAFSGKLSDADLWAVTAYVRALTFANVPGVNLAAVSGTSTPAASTTTSSGTPASTTATTATGPSSTPSASAGTEQASPAVSETPNSSTPAATTQSTLAAASTTPANGTPVPVGSAQGKLVLPADITTIPDGLTVSLLGFDSTLAQVSSATVPVQADGTFKFTNVPMPSGVSFMASVIFNKVTFNSSPSDSTSGTNLNLPITIYDTSTDASVLTVDRLHVFFDFSSANVLQVVELAIISNPTNKAIVAKDGEAVVYFDLPKDATNLQFQDGVLGKRYIQTATGFGDTQAIPPGSGQFQELFAFFVAYPGKADLALPITLPVNAAVVMVPVGGVNLSSSQLADSGQQSVQGQTFHIFTASNIPIKTTLAMTISGLPNSAATTSSTPTNSTSSILIGGGVLLIAVVAAGVFFFRSRRRKSGIQMIDEAETEENEEDGDVDTLIDAIAALDDLHKAGNLPTAAYQQRRAELKERLRKRMQETGALPK